jgi:hypothetical protein
VSSSSTVAVVKAQLVTLITAALPTVQVSRAMPASSSMERESIWLDRRVTGRHEVATIKAGRKHRNEAYTVGVVISVLDQDDQPDVVEPRAMELLTEIEDLLADDPRLGLGGEIDWATAGEFELNTDQSSEPKGWLVEVRLGIDVNARLT